MPYDVRDILGHWVKPTTREAGPCPHACCRGRRPHPDKFPLLWPTKELHRASERQLMYHVTEHCSDARCIAQVERELNRRQNAVNRRERARGRRKSRDADYRAYLENEWVKAEEETRGHMLNRAGQRADVDPRTLWSGSDARRAKYASEDLRRYWDEHRIVTRAEFLGGAAEQTRGGRRRGASQLYGVY